MQMSSDAALAAQGQLFARALEVVKAKRVDYSGPDDPFGNFRQSLFWGVEPWRGAAIRMMDKLSRLVQLSGNAGQGLVLDEEMDDTVIDAINYMVITYLLWKEGQVTPPALEVACVAGGTYATTPG